MFSYWLIGFIGAIAIAIGAIFMLLGIFKTEWFVFGLVICAAGSFMRYISRQTNQTINGNPASSANVSLAINQEKSSAGERDGMTSTAISNVQDKQFLPHEAVLSNDAFKIYLVKKFNIHKDPTLDKFIFNEKLYAELDDALESARREYLDAAGRSLEKTT